MVYRFIQDNHSEFGVNWLLRRLKIVPNAYYNNLKNRKAAYNSSKEHIHKEIASIYHDNNGILGYRSMRVFLERKNIHLSNTTIHKYMNTEMGLISVVRRKKPNYKKERPIKHSQTSCNRILPLQRSITSGVPILHIYFSQTAASGIIALSLICTTAASLQV